LKSAIEQIAKVQQCQHYLGPFLLQVELIPTSSLVAVLDEKHPFQHFLHQEWRFDWQHSRLHGIDQKHFSMMANVVQVYDRGQIQLGLHLSSHGHNSRSHFIQIPYLF
jgi:hypothetical protein